MKSWKNEGENYINIVPENVFDVAELLGVVYDYLEEHIPDPTMRNLWAFEGVVNKSREIHELVEWMVED